MSVLGSLSSVLDYNGPKSNRKDYEIVETRSTMVKNLMRW